MPDSISWRQASTVLAWILASITLPLAGMSVDAALTKLETISQAQGNLATANSAMALSVERLSGRVAVLERSFTDNTIVQTERRQEREDDLRDIRTDLRAMKTDLSRLGLQVERLNAERSARD